MKDVNNIKSLELQDNSQGNKGALDLEQKMKDGKITIEDMHRLCDMDGSGKVSKEEFEIFMKRMG